jgi:hypothetical protein
MNDTDAALRRVRFWTACFIAGLVISGLTAIPLESELAWLVRTVGDRGDGYSAWEWFPRVATGLGVTNREYPFLAYGTDWLAFGHVAIAILFVGAWRDPVRNRWLYWAGLIVCGLVLPWALVMGEVRGIPPGWRLIDCAFGVGGAVPLWICWRETGRLERAAGA